MLLVLGSGEVSVGSKERTFRCKFYALFPSLQYLESLLFKQSTTPLICCFSLICRDIKTFSNAAFVSKVEENGHNFVSDIKLVT